MNVEIINTGTELLLGRVLNTHAQWLCSELAGLGLPVSRQVAIPDNAVAIEEAVRNAVGRADLVITTGGLGPTSDDITRDLIANLLGVELELDAGVAAHIEAFFAARNRAVPANATKQAMVPQGATVLLNANGTAPGLIVPIGKAHNAKKRWLIMLPGPTRELRPMFLNQVTPFLHQELGKVESVCRVFKTTGLGEAFVEQKIAPPLAPHVAAGLEIAYCARVGEVEVRLTAASAPAMKHLPAAEQIVREQLGNFIFAEGDSSLEEVVVRLLTGAKQTLALAESCTGGLIAHRVTNVPGASAVFMAGLVTYSNEAKQALLGVQGATLATHGAVSKETAREMAEGARLRNGTDYAIAVTGIAGPGGGTPEKPVGTVYVALATPGKTVVEKNFNAYERETFKFLTSQQALDLLRKNLVQS